MNKTPLWMGILLIIILLFAILYALPNLFGYDPAVQIAGTIPGQRLQQAEVTQIESDLKKANIPYRSAKLEGNDVLVRFTDSDNQLAGKNALIKSLGNSYVVATMNVTSTPSWLLALNARPMRLGLDLRGGMSLLLQVDVASVIQQRQQNSVRDIAQELRKQNIRYTAIKPSDQGVAISFANQQAMDSAENALSIDQFSQYTWQKQSQGGQYTLAGTLSLPALNQIRQYTIQRTIDTLNRRVNELGVSEAQVQQQGVDRISVDLPGVSDATEAKEILGKTATIETHLVDMQNDAAAAASSGNIPPGDILFKDDKGNPILLKSEVVLSGDNITSASSSLSQQDGRPQVQVQVGGSAQSKLYKITSDNVGKLMAVVYTETKPSQVIKGADGKDKITYKKISRVINVATINDAFGSSFVIMGLSSAASAQQLALLLRAGSLPAALAVLSENQIGPSMGKKNVERGKLSVEVGFILVVLFMLLYYRTMGLIADLALVINLLLIVAIMSLLEGVLTFPGIASLVLTIGMAVDGNVLIFERIREELRQGVPVQTAIQAGYGRAIITIVDAQLTTLIAALVLFGIGSGPIKGFAIVLTIGLFTSMLTAITYTRAMVNFIYGGKKLKNLSIGIKVK
ncbi:MAG: protein translocase subunit SecD [Pseudomonadota bacterium]